MAQCEKCGTVGHDMREMQVDSEKKTFVGPCCVKADPQKLFDKTEFHYGLEVSSHMGVKAYASYGGLTVEFKKSSEDIQRWFQENKQETEQTPPAEEMTSSGPVTSQTMN